MILDKQFLFIIGAPRSGSTWLQALLGAHPLICTSVELNLFGPYTVSWERAWQRQIESAHSPGGFPHGLPALWTEDEFYAFLRKFLECAYTPVLNKKPNATILLDKFGKYSYHVEHINRLIPHALFINLIRDGRDVATSILAASQSWASIWAPDNIEAAASIWKEHVIKAQDAQQYKNRYLEVRYEELLNEGPEALVPVFDFLGLPVDLNEISAIYKKHEFKRMEKEKKMAHSTTLPEGFFRKGRIGSWRDSLSPIQKYIFHFVAGELLCDLGYDDDSWWFEHTIQKVMLPLQSATIMRNGGRKVISRIVKNAAGNS